MNLSRPSSVKNRVQLHAIRVDAARRVWWMFSATRLMRGKAHESLAFLRRRWERTHGETITELDYCKDLCSEKEATRIVELFKRNGV